MGSNQKVKIPSNRNYDKFRRICNKWIMLQKEEGKTSFANLKVCQYRNNCLIVSSVCSDKGHDGQGVPTWLKCKMEMCNNTLDINTEWRRVSKQKKLW